MFVGQINCVRWDSSGNFLATASEDGTAKVLDLKSEKIIYTGTSGDNSKVLHSNSFNLS